MARDPKAREYTISYEGGTMRCTLGLIEYLFGPQVLKWDPDSTATTPLGRKRYKYGARQRSNAAAGMEVFLDLGPEGVFTVRVTGDVSDFYSYVLPKTGDKVKQAWTKRGTEVGPQPEDLVVVP